MNITTHVSFINNDQRGKLISIMQDELEKQGYEQAEIDEIIDTAKDSRLCDIEEIISIKDIKNIVGIK